MKQHTEPLTTEETIRKIGSLFFAMATSSDRILDGWTSIEAFAKIAGMLVRINALPGKETEVMRQAVKAMKEGFASLNVDEFIP